MAITSNCAEIIITNPQGSVSFNKLITTTELSPAKTVDSEDRVYLIQNSENVPQTFWWNLEKAIADGYADLEELYDYFVDEIATQCGGGGVDSVNGQTGVVVLDSGDISEITNKKYVTDAQLTIIGNTSGTNTGDNAANTTSNSYADGKVSDTAYDATSWDAVTGIAPSKNAVRDKIVAMDSAIALNTAKVTNATHTGEVTGTTALTVDKTAITNKTAVTIDTADYVLISDSSDSGNLKKGLVSDLGGFDDGDFTLVASFKSLYNY